MIGPCLTYHMGGGEGGMAYCLEQFGPSLKYPWSRLDAPELTVELSNELVRGSNVLADNRDFETLNKQRDEALVGINKLLSETFCSK